MYQSRDIAIFVDGSNMFYAQREQGWNIDYEKILQHFKSDKNLFGAYYFASYSTDTEKLNKYKKFKHFLIKSGYTVEDKALHTTKDKKTGNIIRKGNLDIELCFKMLTTYETWNEAILLGVDIDFIPVIRYLQQSSKVIKIVGNQNMTSTEMINTANNFIDLKDIKRIVMRG